MNNPNPSLLLPLTPEAIHSSPTPDIDLNSAIFAPIREILRTSGITRECKTLTDEIFIVLCLMRVMQNTISGRDFLQTHGQSILPELNRGNYFASLSSGRRLKLIRSLAVSFREKYLPILRDHDDRLKIFPELNGWQVWAADGHKIQHATHDPRNASGSYTASNSIFRFDLRTGYAEFLALCKLTDKSTEHEITTLKGLDPKELRCGAIKGQSTLLVYDRAIIDFTFSYNLKQTKSIYTATRVRVDLSPVTSIPREIDRSNPANALVISDETITFKGAKGNWRKITSWSPDHQEVYTVLANEMTLPCGVINECVRLRWNIEKAFDQHEQKFGEDKAWGKSEIGKKIQAIAVCLAHNLIELFKMTLKCDENIEDTKVITSYHREIEISEKTTIEKGFSFPKKIYLALYRPTEVSLQFIRWLRQHLTLRTLYRTAIASLRPLMKAYL